jgi:hypothetical protein
MKICARIPSFISDNRSCQSLAEAGGNFGNIVFWKAAHTFIKKYDKSYTNLLSGLNPESELYIDIQANLISEFSKTRIARLSEQLENMNSNKNVLFSVGAQNQDLNTFPLFSNRLKKNLEKYFSNFDRINLRGHYTQELLIKNNIEFDFDVKGCPSSLLLKNIRIKNPEVQNSKNTRICLNMPTKNTKQPQEIYHLFKHLENRKDIITLQQTSRTSKKLNSFDKFKSQLQNVDLVIGTRIHGSILSLHAGTPCVCIAIDSRTLELCMMHGIPYIDYTEEKNKNKVMSAYTKEKIISLANNTINTDFKQARKSGKNMEKYLKSIIK